MDLSPKAMKIKAKINKCNLIKLNIFYSKGDHKQTKRQLTEWEKVFANNMTEKGLTANIYKQLIQINIKKWVKKIVKEQSRYFPKEDM